jgi:hypothetical protein
MRDEIADRVSNDAAIHRLRRNYDEESLRSDVRRGDLVVAALDPDGRRRRCSEALHDRVDGGEHRGRHHADDFESDSAPIPRGEDDPCPPQEQRRVEAAVRINGRQEGEGSLLQCGKRFATQVLPPGPGDVREHLWLQKHSPASCGNHRAGRTRCISRGLSDRPIVFSPLISARGTKPQPMKRVFMEGNAGGKRCAKNSMTRGLDAFSRDWVVFRKRGTEGRGTVASSQGTARGLRRHGSGAQFERVMIRSEPYGS